MRDLGLHLAHAGNDVTHITMRHWNLESPPDSTDVRVIGVTEAGRVYSDERRTLLPPIRFGLGVARHLWRHGSDYDVVHMASFPYFPLLAASALRKRAGYRLVVNWIEVWTQEYWRRYGGVGVGTVGWLVQRTCIRIPHDAYCISRMHADRLVAEGYRRTPVVLPGLYAGPIDPTLPTPSGSEAHRVCGPPCPREAGRSAGPGRSPLARRELPDLRLEIYGEGPESDRIARLAAAERDGRRRATGRQAARGRGRRGDCARSLPRERFGTRGLRARRGGSGRARDARASSLPGPRMRRWSSSTTASTASWRPTTRRRALLPPPDRRRAGAALRESTARWFERTPRAADRRFARARHGGIPPRRTWLGAARSIAVA